jgi:hypothetical protein
MAFTGAPDGCWCWLSTCVRHHCCLVSARSVAQHWLQGSELADVARALQTTTLTCVYTAYVSSVYTHRSDVSDALVLQGVAGVLMCAHNRHMGSAVLASNCWVTPCTTVLPGHLTRCGACHILKL